MWFWLADCVPVFAATAADPLRSPAMADATSADFAVVFICVFLFVVFVPPQAHKAIAGGKAFDVSCYELRRTSLFRAVEIYFSQSRTGIAERSETILPEPRATAAAPPGPARSARAIL